MTHPLYDARLDNLGISVFDLETTGLFSARDRIIQVAVVPIDNGSISSKGWMKLVNPGEDHLPLKPIISNLTRIKSTDLEGKPLMGEVIREFDTLVGTRVVAGHNIKSFDLKFMEMAERRHDVDVQTDYYIDTLILMRRLYQGLSSYKLSACGRHYGIDFKEEDLHDALEDTRLTAKVLLAQISDLADRNVNTFGEMLSFLS